MHCTVILGHAFSVTVPHLLPRRRDFLESCETLLSKLPPNQYVALEPFMQPSKDPDDCRFWDESEGVPGMLRRLRTSAIFVQLIQLHYRDGRISKTDAQYIWRKIAMQAYFTARALPEAAICAMWCDMPRIAARAALNFYGEVVISSQTTISDGPPGPPQCTSKLFELL